MRFSCQNEVFSADPNYNKEIQINWESLVFITDKKFHVQLTLLWRRPLSYRNQSIDLQSKSMDWFLYDNGLRHERVKDVVMSHVFLPIYQNP